MSPKKKKQREESRGLLSIQKRSRALARVLNHSILVKTSERSPEEVLNMVEEHGFEFVLDFSYSHSYIPSWKKVYEKLLSIAHLIRGVDARFLDIWLRVCADQDDVLLRLYLQERPFFQKKWGRGCGTVLLQLELPRLLYYAISSTQIAIANKEVVQIYDRNTGRKQKEFLCSAITGIELVYDCLYVGSSNGMWKEGSVSLERLDTTPVHSMTSYAGWIARIDNQRQFQLLSGELSHVLTQDSSCITFCHRGLGVAIGTEQGQVVLIREQEKTKTIQVSSSTITTLCWKREDELWIGDEEGGVWYFNGHSVVSIDRKDGSVLSLDIHNLGLTALTAEGCFESSTILGWLPQPYAASQFAIVRFAV